MKDLLNDIELKKQFLKYQAALQTIENQINILSKEFEFEKKYSPIEHVKTRIKTMESATKKLQERGYEVTLDNLIKHIHDMVGIRIVCAFISDVYDIAEVIDKSDQIRVKERQDYIKEPKDSGYTSYHMLVEVPVYFKDTTENVEVEIQIRTISMDFWASIDHKIQYKFSGNIPEEVKDEMYQCALDIKALDKKMFKLNKIVNKYNKDN